MRRFPVLAASLLLIASLGGLATAQSPSVDEAPDVAGAVERTLADKTVFVTTRVSMEAPGVLLEPMLIMDVSGQTSFGVDTQTRIEGEVASLGFISVIIDGSDVYIAADGLAEILPEGSYLYIDSDAPAPGFEEISDSMAVGNDAALALYWLLGADGPLEIVGHETVGGVETVHLDVPIDLDLARDHVPPETLPVFDSNREEMLASGADVDHAQAWVDDDGLVRRVAYDMQVALEDITGTLFVDYEFSDLGEPIELRIPEPEHVVDAWSLIYGE